VAQRLILVYYVDIDPALASFLYISFVNQIGDDPLHGSFRDTDLICYFAGCDLTVLADQPQHGAVISDKSPDGHGQRTPHKNLSRLGRQVLKTPFH
jgi:hypothetical protein